MSWEFTAIHPETLFGHIAGTHLGPEKGRAVNRMMSIYERLRQPFRDAKHLQSTFRDEGKYIFSTQQAARLFKRFSRRGGGVEEDSVLNKGVGALIDMASGNYTSAPNPAFDQGIEAIQNVIRMVLPFVFMLNTLEHTPLFGEMVGAALDITAGILPVTAMTIQSEAPALIGLVPLPFAGTIGMFLGWLFSFFFLWLAMVIGISRKDFASAVEATAGMIPIIGGPAMRGVGAIDKVVTKLAGRAVEIRESITNVYGSMRGALDTVLDSPQFQKLTEMSARAQNTLEASKHKVSEMSARAQNTLEASKMQGGRSHRRRPISRRPKH